jgi:hypothetical protein
VISHRDDEISSSHQLPPRITIFIEVNQKNSFCDSEERHPLSWEGGGSGIVVVGAVLALHPMYVGYHLFHLLIYSTDSPTHSWIYRIRPTKQTQRLGRDVPWPRVKFSHTFGGNSHPSQMKYEYDTIRTPSWHQNYCNPRLLTPTFSNLPYTVRSSLGDAYETEAKPKSSRCCSLLISSWHRVDQDLILLYFYRWAPYVTGRLA